ncbi:MAG: toll/interleukin-1 receptor domain-containing protein [Chloroflexi bacterium]|nr:toll/interleukin-1 receptor domain-containing protein [Chloroflexota bacterium]
MDYFITYNAADQKWAEWIGAKLVEAGYSVELQSYDYWARSSLILEMFAVSAIADSTIAVLSPDFLAENLDRPEWQAAHAQDPAATAGVLVAVRVKECDVAGTLPAVQYVDVVGLDALAAEETLLAGVEKKES